MSSRAELATLSETFAGEIRTKREKLILCLVFSWGLSAFFPVGLMYLHLVLLLAAVAVSPDLRQRVLWLWRCKLLAPIFAVLAWTFFIAVIGDWYPDTATRLFHATRVALVLSLGVMLNRLEARLALAGFLAGSLIAAFIVAAHHVWGLPDWAIWSSLLSLRNNFSSGNMITMATASGLFFFLGIRSQTGASDRWLMLAASAALATIVALHSLSRNSQFLLAVLLMTSVLYRFRTVRASLVGIALVAALAGATWQYSANTQDRFGEMYRDLRSAENNANYSNSVGVRWRMYQEAAQGMIEHPFFGAGVGSWLPRWRAVWLSLEEKLPPEEKHPFSEINNPHNDFLLAGMETGVMGMLLLTWLMWRFMRLGWRQHSIAGGMSMVMAVAMFATASVNAPFRDAALGMTLLWLLGASVAAQRRAPDA